MKVAIIIIMLIACIACTTKPQFVIVDNSGQGGNTYFIETDKPVTIIYPETGRTVVVEATE